MGSCIARILYTTTLQTLSTSSKTKDTATVAEAVAKGLWSGCGVSIKPGLQRLRFETFPARAFEVVVGITFDANRYHRTQIQSM